MNLPFFFILLATLSIAYSKFKIGIITSINTADFSDKNIQKNLEGLQQQIAQLTEWQQNVEFVQKHYESNQFKWKLPSEFQDINCLIDASNDWIIVQFYSWQAIKLNIIHFVIQYKLDELKREKIGANSLFQESKTSEYSQAIIDLMKSYRWTGASIIYT